MWSYAVLAAVSSCYPPVQARLLTRYSPVRRSVILKASFQNASLDLHVLGTPPAFVLSQDQTLLFNLDSLILLILRYPFGINFVVQNILSCFDLSFFSSLCTFQGAFPLPPWPPATVGLLIISNLLPFVNSFLPFFCYYFFTLSPCISSSFPILYIVLTNKKRGVPPHDLKEISSILFKAG